MSICDILEQHLPFKKKRTPSGWWSFNAVCCHHQGHNPDQRNRGGFIKTPESGFSYHCFNCGFKTGWAPGKQITYKNKTLFYWLNLPDELINKICFMALKSEATQIDKIDSFIFDFQEIKLPEHFMKIEENDKYHEYLKTRTIDINDYIFYKSKNIKFRSRLIIPFFYQRKIVGWTCRSINNQKPKYITQQPPNFVFNLDNQKFERQFLIVVEGPFDALQLDGIALLGSEISEQQKRLIENPYKEIIVVPDRDNNGKQLMEKALEFGWSISMPDWPEDIKDADEAVNKMGKIYTLYSIIKSRQDSKLKNLLKSKKWFK